MSFNKSLLTMISQDLKKKKKPSRPRVPRNQWQHPGEVTTIPSNNITMDGVSYPVLGVPNVGTPQMMYPDQNYHFPDARKVVEVPMMMRKGGHVFGKMQVGGQQDSTVENILEIFDPSGISSWDDVQRSYIKSGMSPETKMEIFGALPLLGKVGKFGKMIGNASKVGLKARHKDGLVGISKLIQSVPYIGRGSDILQAAEQGPAAPFFPSFNVVDYGPQFGRYAGSPALKQKQEGGPTRVSINDPRYPELYKNRQVGAYYDGAYSLPDLPEVTVTGKDERLKEAMSQGSGRFLQGLAGVLGSPQTGMMEVITGKQQTPSQAIGFQNPGGWLDNYSSFGKNVSNFAMDAVLDPMNVLGVGIADDIARTSLRTAGRNVTRQAPVSARVTYNLMDDSIDPFGDVLKNVKIDNSPSSFAEDIRREALDYQQLTRDPRYLERVRRIDKDFGSKMEPLLESFNRQPEDTGRFLPFNISVRDEIIDSSDESIMGQSGLSAYGLRKLNNQGWKMPWSFNRGRRNTLTIDPAKDRYVEISEKAHRQTNEPVRGTVRHELKHHWTNALIDAENKNYGQGLKSFIAPRRSVVADASDRAANTDYNYFSNPTEVDAHLMTDMRDEMVQRGYLKDHFDELTEDKLNDFLSKEKKYRAVGEYFSPAKQMVGDKAKFVDFFNKYGLPSTVTGGVLGSQAMDKKKSGGQTRDEREMVNGIADILKQVRDKQNREQIARQMMADFEREDVTYDMQDFRKMAKLQEGGIQRISVSDPRYPQMYKNRQVGAYYDGAYSLPDLDEVTVTGKDDRIREGMSQGIGRFYGHVSDLMGAPQKEAMQFITGKEQTPSEAWGFDTSGKAWYHPKTVSNFLMDGALDPVNAIPGVGLIDDLTRGAVRGAAQNAVSKTFKYGVPPYTYDSDVIASIPENLIRAAQGKPKKLPKSIVYLTESVPTIKRTINDTNNNREDAWSVYLGLPPENKGLKLVGSDKATGLSKYELTKHRIMKPYDIPDYAAFIDIGSVDSKRLNFDKPGDVVVDRDGHFGVMGGYSKFVSPDGKSIMYRDVWDLQPFSKSTFKKLPTKLGEAVRNFEVSSVIPGAKPFVAEGKLADIKTRYSPAKRYKNIQTRFNEELGFVSDYYEPSDFITDIYDPSPEEIFNYEQMLRDHAKRRLLKQIKNEKTFLNPVYNQDSRKYADFAPYIKVDVPKVDVPKREKSNIADSILKQLKVKQTGGQIARQMIADFKRDDVTYDTQDFKDMAQLKYGGHGGLDRWFAEKWVDVKTGKDCGRQEGESRKGYPACRPSKRVTSDTPKTAGELSSSEKAKFKREKTSSERISYNHKKAEGGQTGWLEKYN